MFLIVANHNHCSLGRSSRNLSSVSLASPLAKSRAGRNNSPRIDYRTGKKLEDIQKPESSKSSSKPDPSKKGKDSEAAKPSKSSSKVSISSQREERKRNKEKNYDSAGSPSTDSPRPKRNLNSEDTGEARKPR